MNSTWAQNSILCSSNFIIFFFQKKGTYNFNTIFKSQILCLSQNNAQMFTVKSLEKHWALPRYRREEENTKKNSKSKREKLESWAHNYTTTLSFHYTSIIKVTRQLAKWAPSDLICARHTSVKKVKNLFEKDFVIIFTLYASRKEGPKGPI